MDEPSDSSPFAAFAMPRRSAVEEFEERQRRSAQTRRRMVGFVLSCLIGAVGGATTCAAFEKSLDVVFTSLAGAMAGSLIGVASGLVIGAMCFSAMMMTARGKPGLDADLARRDPMAAMRGLMFAWSLIGVAVGAAQGALFGVRWAGAAVKFDPLGRWTMVGSILGGAFAIAVWFFALRSMAPSHPHAEPPETA